MIVDDLLMDAQNLLERLRMTDGAWFQTKVLSSLRDLFNATAQG